MAGCGVALAGLANLDLATGDFERAEDGYRAALERDPPNVAARNNLAETLERRGCVDRRASRSSGARARGGTALEARVSATAAEIAAARTVAAPSGPAAPSFDDRCRDLSR